MVKPVFKQILRWSSQKVTGLRKANSGDWAWLDVKPMPLPVLNRKLWKVAEPSIPYYVLLSLSVVIATLGLLANSAATIIGAMIVAPLMGPILGMAFSMIMSNRRLLRRSTLALVTGALMSIAIGAMICQLVGIETLTPEITARTSPNLLDLGVALAAGGAGAFAFSRRDIADALPGVAIAVALVPPLSVIGIGIALNLQDVTFGSSLLFLTNLTGIIFSGGLVLLLQRYGSLARAQKGLTVAIVALLILGIPLALSFQDVVIREQTRSQINQLIRQETLTFSDKDIRSLTVQRHQGQLLVDLEVSAPAGEISDRQVDLVREFLQNQTERAIALNVTVIPTEQFISPVEE
ncbi:TIGR00341 family protein [filamentous cyanobacterium CCP1]|nr:TIGR00341 family protein [filamentous cyanobacterium CCP2]PSB67754.1 TIGR00341 family protein [filamentous cyanobacterium CCP1]